MSRTGRSEPRQQHECYSIEQGAIELYHSGALESHLLVGTRVSFYAEGGAPEHAEARQAPLHRGGV